ncbi:hypothetical protein HRbin24_00720 [bacterium HR24]|jgi:hypothetical protein|nr:hypothetical protein HRbin24_00720 [bacterium HR24]
MDDLRGFWVLVFILVTIVVSLALGGLAGYIS